MKIADEELDWLALAHSPEFQTLLGKSRRQIEETGCIPHELFWKEVKAENREANNRHGQPKGN